MDSMRITKKFLTDRQGKKPIKDEFYRDNTLGGFGLKWTKAGKLNFIVEGRVRGGKTCRLTLGQYPQLDLEQAKTLAREPLLLMSQGIDPRDDRRAKQEAKAASEAQRNAMMVTVGDLWEKYLRSKDYKPSTLRDNKQTFDLVYGHLRGRVAASITPQEVEDLYYEAKEQRGAGQANKANRYLQAFFNWCKAERVNGERLIKENPCDVLKEKRIKTTIKARSGYLTKVQLHRLFRYFYDEWDWHYRTGKIDRPKGVSQDHVDLIEMYLRTGLRRNELLGMKWPSVDFDEGFFVVEDTKNGKDHYLPMVGITKDILSRRYIERDTDWVFPNRQRTGPRFDAKDAYRKIGKATGLDFTIHDLRRTFSTHAVGIGFSEVLVAKGLNHSKQSVTQGYIVSNVDMVRPLFDRLDQHYKEIYDPFPDDGAVAETLSPEELEELAAELVLHKQDPLSEFGEGPGKNGDSAGERVIVPFQQVRP